MENGSAIRRVLLQCSPCAAAMLRRRNLEQKEQRPNLNLASPKGVSHSVTCARPSLGAPDINTVFGTVVVGGAAGNAGHQRFLLVSAGHSSVRSILLNVIKSSTRCNDMPPKKSARTNHAHRERKSGWKGSSKSLHPRILDAARKLLDEC